MGDFNNMTGNYMNKTEEKRIEVCGRGGWGVWGYYGKLRGDYRKIKDETKQRYMSVGLNK